MTRLYQDGSISRVSRAAHRRVTALACVLLAAAELAGCAGSEDTVGRVLVAPGGYDYYNCQQLASTAQSLRTRLQELEGLMGKSSQGAGGGLVNAMVYQPDYLNVRGQLNELRRTAAAKNCDERQIAGQPAKPAIPKPPPDLAKPR